MQIGKLTLGYQSDLYLREVALRSRKLTGLRNPFRIAFLSDIHLNRWNAGTVIADLERALSLGCERTGFPLDAVLLGGDLMDEPGGIGSLSPVVTTLRRHSSVIGFALGNHDKWVGSSRIRRVLIDLDAVPLEEQPISLRWDGAHLVLHSTCSGRAPGGDGAFGVNVLHFPPGKDTPRADLTLFGHSHGGQLVAWERASTLYPLGLFSRHASIDREWQGRRWIQSRGVNDTLPIRWNCPREIILATLLPDAEESCV